MCELHDEKVVLVLVVPGSTNDMEMYVLWSKIGSLLDLKNLLGLWG